MLINESQKRGRDRMFIVVGRQPEDLKVICHVVEYASVIVSYDVSNIMSMRLEISA